MRKLIQKIQQQPEAVRKKIFMFTMIGFFVAIFSLYMFSIKNSIEYSLEERASASESLPGEFQLPSIKESVSANIKDLIDGIRGNNDSE